MADVKPRKIGDWLRRVLPYIVFGGLVGLYTYFYFFRPSLLARDYLQFLLNAATGLAVVLYVIYTRELVKSGQLTAQANLDMIATMRCLILEEWVAQDRQPQEINLLPRDAEELSRRLHVEDLGMPADKYAEHYQADKRRVLIFRPYNSGPRLLLLKRFKIEVVFGKGVPREVVCDLEHPLRVVQNQPAEIHIVYNFMGQVDARVIEIEYLDGDRVLKTWIACPFSERAYFAPAGAQ